MIRGDILAMAQDVARAKPLFDSDRERFQQFLSAQATIRGLPLAVILNGDLEVIERTNVRATQDFAIPNKEVLKNAKRHRAASRADSGIQLRRERHQAARL